MKEKAHNRGEQTSSSRVHISERQETRGALSLNDLDDDCLV